MTLSRKTRYLPAFIEGSDTLFVGQGTVAAYDDFSHLGRGDIQVAPGRTAVTVRLPEPQLGLATSTSVIPMCSRSSRGS